MYNKIFAKILDSTVWLLPTPTRIVWITFLAAMDEDGYVALASVQNVARRAIVTDAEAQEAVAALEAPDAAAAGQEHDGRRIERVPGGWFVLNAVKYREIATRDQMKESARERQRRHRESKRSGHAPVTDGHAPSLNVTQSEAYTDTEVRTPIARFARVWAAYPNHRDKKHAVEQFAKLKPTDELTDVIVAAIEKAKATDDHWRRGFVPYLFRWLRDERWTDETTAAGGPAPSKIDPDVLRLCELASIKRYDIDQWFVGATVKTLAKTREVVLLVPDVEIAAYIRRNLCGALTAALARTQYTISIVTATEGAA